MNTLRKHGFVAKKYNSLFFAYLLGWVVSLIGSLSDSVLAGMFISEDAVAAVELVTPLFNILMFFATLIGVGVSTLFSTYLGAFDKEKAAKVNGMGLIISVASGVLFTVLMFVFKDAYFAFYGSGGAIDILGREYYACFYLLAFSYPIYWLIYFLVSADGDAGMILACDVVTAVSNPIFSLMLVNKLGIVGLGYGTVISNLITIVFLIIHLLKKSNAIKFKLYLSGKEFAKIFAIGSSISLAQVYLAVVDIVFNKFIISNFGSGYLAAYAVVNLILNLGGCFCCSINAAEPFVCVAYGEKNTVAQKNVLRHASKYAFVLGIIFTVLEFLLAGVLPGLFGISSPEVYDSAVYAGKVLAFMNLGLAFEYELAVYYPQVNKSLLGNMYSIIYSLIAPLALAIPLALIGGFNGMVWGFFLTPFVTLLFGYIFVSIKYGKKMYPFIIPESKDKIFVHEIEVNETEIVALNSLVDEDLKTCNVPTEMISQVQLMIEETFMIVKEKNPSKKILGDCSLMVSDDRVHLITRDNGKIFNITDVNTEINSLRQYVAARMIEKNSGAEYLTTISFNRNSFLWERNQN